MWKITDLKNGVKPFLKKYYWKLFLVCLIMGVTGSYQSFLSIEIIYNFTDIINQEFFTSILILLLFLKVTVGFHIKIGCSKYLLEIINNHENYNNLIYYIKKSYYLNILKTMILRIGLIICWFLLFLIPGFIKLYSYKMVPYILAENPLMEPKEVIKLSVKITKGNRLNMLLLDISFAGWFILFNCFFIYGAIFVYPYLNLTYAKLYKNLTISNS